MTKRMKLRPRRKDLPQERVLVCRLNAYSCVLADIHSIEADGGEAAGDAADEKNDGSPEAETPAPGESPAAEPGMYTDSL